MKTIEQRFWEKVTPAAALDCWEWAASRNDAGYGQININGRPQRAHRIAYELLRATIPDGLQLDHLCRNRACVNPWHLEPVTNDVNTSRGLLRSTPRQQKTHCPQEHPYTGDNLVIRQGYRVCRQCERATSLRSYYTRRAVAE